MGGRNSVFLRLQGIYGHQSYHHTTVGGIYVSAGGGFKNVLAVCNLTKCFLNDKVFCVVYFYITKGDFRRIVIQEVKGTLITKVTEIIV